MKPIPLLGTSRVLYVYCVSKKMFKRVEPPELLMLNFKFLIHNK